MVRCEECGMVHPFEAARERLVQVRVIVNRDGLSQPHRIRLPASEVLTVGEGLLVDDPSREVVMTEITSLEAEGRVVSAPAQNVRTVWARATDVVSLKISVYRNGRSHPIKVQVPGDEVLSVGEVRSMGGFRFHIVKIKLRGEGFADAAEAKDILRVWGRAT